MTIIATPELGIPIPTDFSPEEIPDLLARAKAAFRTREFLLANGLIEPDPNTPEGKKQIEAAARESAKQFTDSPVASRRPMNAETAKWLNDLLYRYNNRVVEDTVRLKNYVTTRLIEESDGEKAADRLRALESLGKLSQLGMFADKVEISVTHKSTDQLQDELQKKLSRFMGDVVEVKSEIQKKRERMVIDLDKELGISRDDDRV